MATIRFGPLWTIGVEHAFHGGGAAEVLDFIVPPSTARALAGARALARVHGGRLHVLVERDEAGVPLAPLAGRRFVFGLRPRAASFALVTTPLPVPPGEVPLWDNRADAGTLGAPQGVRLSGPQLRIVPDAVERPLTLRLFDAADALHAQTVLGPGAESWTLPGLYPEGSAWRVEAQGAGAATGWRLRVEPELLDVWGLLELTVDATHLAGGQAFTLAFAAPSETLRYYVVATRYSAAEFDQVSIVDAGAAADARPPIAFQRTLPADFAPGHLSPALLDPSGAARVALFEAQSPVARRVRGPTGIELRRNGDVLIGHLPQPGAERPDAQFVVHLTQS
jgi:hypothetical protein